MIWWRVGGCSFRCHLIWANHDTFIVVRSLTECWERYFKMILPQKYSINTACMGNRWFEREKCLQPTDGTTDRKLESTGGIWESVYGKWESCGWEIGIIRWDMRISWQEMGINWRGTRISCREVGTNRHEVENKHRGIGTTNRRWETTEEKWEKSYWK